eukprot:113561_1
MTQTATEATTEEDNFINDENYSINIGLVSNNPFKWMDKVSLYIPMVSFKASPHKQRSYLMSVVCSIATAVICTAIFVYWSILSFLSSNTGYMYDILFFIAFLLKTLSRLILLYYYYKKFTFPWYLLNLTADSNAITRARRRIIFVTVGMIILFIGQMSRKCVELTTGKETYFEALLYLVEMYLLEIPNIFGQFTFSIIVLNTQMQIEELIELISAYNITNEETEIFKDALSEYKKLYNKLKSEYYPMWFWISILKLFSIILWFWIAITNYKNTMYDSPFAGMLWSLWNLMFLIEFICSSNDLSKSYHKFQDVIWETEDKKEIFQNNNDKLNYLFLRDYVVKHKATVKLMKGGEVSIKNAFVFIAVFIFAQVAMYRVLE